MTPPTPLRGPDQLPAADRGAAPSPDGTVAVRLWASARAAADGVGALALPIDAPMSVEALRTQVVAQVAAIRPDVDRDRLARVLEVCSVLVDSSPAHDPALLVQTGSEVEFLPPFAGG